MQTLEFPGGNIGSLAVHGTVNDLAVSVFLEEGLEVALLRRERAQRGLGAKFDILDGAFPHSASP